LQEVERNWPAQNVPIRVGPHDPVQESGPAAAAGVALESARNAGTAIASPLITRFMNVRRVFGEPKRVRDQAVQNPVPNDPSC